MRRSPISPVAIGALLALVAACAGPAADDEDGCAGGKCDVPDGPDGEMCALRRADAFDPNQLAFTPGFLRWSCSDVEGVTEADRGQEYCEYFAIVALPPSGPEQAAPAPRVLGKNLGPDHTYGTTETTLELDYDELTALEDAGSEIVGQCVFTSWNSDVPEPVPACAEGGGCPELLGLPVDQDGFRMRFDVNSHEAAALLVDDCVAGEPAAIEDDFERGCMMNARINDTAFRKSDSFVCAATMRVAECGCALVDATPLGEAIAGPGRGFPLGTWSDPAGLPVGCRHVALDDDSRTVVACDLSAAEVITNAFDLKGHCQSAYGDNVVVHVPMPAPDAIACAVGAEAEIADGCGATPWLLDPY